MEQSMKRFGNGLAEKLREAGYGAEPVEVMKNGILCNGIRIIDPLSPQVSPIVYYNPEDTVESILQRIQAVIRCGNPEVNVTQITDPEYLAGHVYLTVQRCSQEEVSIVKKPCLNLELVLRVFVPLGDHTGSAKVTQEMLRMADISEDAAWMMAMYNMRQRLRIQSLAEALELPEYYLADVPLFLCTTEGRTDGAAGLAFPDLFQGFCEQRGVGSCWLLPYSTEELVVVPEDIGSISTSDMVQMVADVNQSMVDPLIQLEPVAYRYGLKENQITIADRLRKGGVQ